MFQAFPKISRYFRNIVITEKIDGCNACVIVTENSEGGPTILAQSRKQLITPERDNFGFAKWVEENREALLKLGPGHHFGEWWGAGIQRGYNQTEKHFSLFNTAKWVDDTVRPSCCRVVPVLYAGRHESSEIRNILGHLNAAGSLAAPGFMRPEGIVIFHTAASICFKVTLKNDDKGKEFGA